MRLLHVVPSYLPATRYGGPIYSVHGLCKSLANRGHEVHVYTTNVDGVGNTDVPLKTKVDFDGIKVWFFPSNCLRRLYWSPPMLDSLQLTVSTFDVLHLHSIFLWPTWAAARMARNLRIPYIVSPRGMLVKDLIHRKSFLAKLLWIRCIEKKNIERAAAIHCTSQIESAECQAFDFKFPRISVIPNGIEDRGNADSAVISKPNIRQVIKRQPLILFLGRINWKKGLDRLIPAMPYIADAHLAIAGNDDDDYTREVLAIAEKSGVANRITLLGSVGDSDKAVLYRNAKVFVLTSYSENFGNAVLEALAYECPAVITPEVGVAQAIAEAGAGMVVDGTPGEIAGAVNKLLSNENLRANMGRTGARLIQEKYRWNRVAQHMEAEYQLHI